MHYFSNKFSKIA